MQPDQSEFFRLRYYRRSVAKILHAGTRRGGVAAVCGVQMGSAEAVATHTHWLAGTPHSRILVGIYTDEHSEADGDGEDAASGDESEGEHGKEEEMSEEGEASEEGAEGEEEEGEEEGEDGE